MDQIHTVTRRKVYEKINMPSKKITEVVGVIEFLIEIAIVFESMNKRS